MYIPSSATDFLNVNVMQQQIRHLEHHIYLGVRLQHTSPTQLTECSDHVHWRDSKSASVFALPLMGITVKLNSCRVKAQLSKRLLRVRDICKNVKGLWSVCRVKCLPMRKRESFVVAHTIAKHSRSIVEYLSCVSENFCEIHFTG